MSIKKEQVEKQLRDVAAQFGELASLNLTGDVAFEENKLFTVVLAFSDHADAIAQYETNSPLVALELFIEKSGEFFDRISASGILIFGIMLTVAAVLMWLRIW